MADVDQSRAPPNEARLFHAAMRVRADARDAFLRRACRGALPLVEEVRADLEAITRTEDRFDLGPARFTTHTRRATATGHVPVEALLGLTLGGRYVLKAEVGRGSSGAVFRALDVTTGVARAVKVFSVGNDDERDAVVREIAVLRGLRVPGVVPLLDEGDDGPYAYLVMPLLQGTPFAGGRVGWNAVRGPALGLLETLERIHDLGVVHRDLKPSNVLVDDAGLATVLDVGASGGPEGVAPEALLAGTFDWMAPEQRRGQTSPKSDLFAFALLTLSAVTGRPAAALRADGRNTTRGPRAADVAPDLPTEVATVLDRCLAPDPVDRPASAHEVLGVLAARPAHDDRLPLLRASAKRLGTLTETALRALFRGTVRIHHLPDDAARELFLRTEGRIEAVEAELAAWTRAGLARRDGDAFTITRDALDRLSESELVLQGGPQRDPPDTRDEELIVAAVLAGRSARIDVLARALQRDEADVQTRLEALEAAGHVRRVGPRVASVGALPSTRWDDTRRDGMRRHLVEALPAGDPARFWNLLRLPDATPAQVAHEAMARDAWRSASHWTVLRTAARLLRGRPEEAGRLDVVLIELVTSATRTNQVVPMLEAVREVELAGGGPLRASLRAIGRAAIWTACGEAQRAFRALEPMPDHDPELGWLIHRNRTLAARFLPLDVEDQAVARATAHFAQQRRTATSGEPSGEMLGWHAFRRGRFRDAARWFERAAQGAPHDIARAATWVSAATAWIQVDAYDGAATRGGPDDALHHARTTLKAAWEAIVKVRHAQIESMIAHTETEIAYRSEDAGLRPDPERTKAAATVDDPIQVGLALYLEAAIAWRCGATALAGDLALQSAAASLRGGRWGTAASARSLARLCGATVAETAESDVDLASASPHAGIRVQVLAMIGAATPALRSLLRPLVGAAAQALPREVWSRRREVLSVDEALRLIDASV